VIPTPLPHTSVDPAPPPSSAEASRYFELLLACLGRASVGVRSEHAQAPLRITVDFRGAYLPREIEQVAGYGGVSLAESVEVERAAVERMGGAGLVLFREGETVRGLVMRLAVRLAARVPRAG
jgi:hypothetical protein